MNKTEIIKHIIIDQGIKQLTLAKRLGIASNTLSMRITRGNITLDMYIDMLKALNYKIVVLPDSVKTPKDAYEVTKE